MLPARSKEKRSSTSKTIPFLITLIVPFMLLTAVTIGLIGYLSFHSGRQAVNDVVIQLRAEITSQIEDRLETFLTTPQLINQINADLIRQNIVPADDPAALEQHFWEQIQTFETVTSIYFGNTAGGLVDAGREGAGGFLYLIATDEFASGPFKKYTTDAQGNRSELLLTVPDFDARTRPWYINASETGAAAWSNIYILFTGQDMAIAASQPVYDPSGHFLGVVSNDIFLSHITDFLQTLDIGRTGEAFIVEHSGLLVASSTGEPLFTAAAENGEPQRRLTAAESNTPLVREGIKQLTAQFGGLEAVETNQQFEFHLDGQRYFAQVTPFHDIPGLDWLIVVIIPEANFLAEINANVRTTILLIVATLGLAAGGGILIANQVTQPIVTLNNAAKSLAAGETPPTITGGRIRELRELAHSFNTMAHQLNHTLDNLKAEVTERRHIARELQKRERFVTLLNNITYASLKSTNFQEMLQTLANRLGELIAADGCYLTLWDEAEQTVRPAAAYGTLSETYSSVEVQPGETTMTASVLQAEQTLIAEDVFNSPYVSPRIAALFPTRSMIGLPLLVGNQKLGAALIVFDTPHRFTPEEIAHCEQASQQIALAIAQARNLQHLERRATEMTALYELSLEINTQTDVSTVLQTTVSRAAELLGTDMGGLWLLKPDGETLELVVEHNQPPGVLGIQLRLGEGLSGRIVQSGEPLVINDYQIWEGKIAAQPIARVIGVPLKQGEKVIGVLNVFDATKTGTFDENQVQLLRLFAAQAAVALEKVHLFETLQESESRNRAMLSAMPDLMFVQNREGVFLDYHAPDSNALFISPEQFLGRKMQEIFPEEVTAPLFPLFEQALTTQQMQLYEYQLPHAGQMRHFEARLVPYGDDKILSIIREITKQKELEVQLLQARKMESIGRLAGGIAHDFNNLLVPMMSYLDLSLMRLEPGSKLYRNLTQVRKAADRAADLTHQILAFSRKQMLEMQLLNLNEVIADFQTMIQRLIRENIELKTILTPELHPVKADRGQIEQVLLNLVVNARDAMPTGGTLTIETDNVYLDEAYVAKYADAQPTGHYVMIAITDTGSGMDTDTQKQIFEPFFTTKEQGKGTGLGLATVFGIIKQHGGNIWVYSEPDKGATFKIYLPQAEDEFLPAESPPTEPSSVFGTETILVVEDEPLVRELVSETLTAHGYQVIKADTPTAGLQLASHYKDPIDLLLTDVIMPEMNGRELYQQISRLYPQIKVLYMSGYTDNIVINHGILYEGVNFLPKPFTVHTLTVKVKQLLG